jgi:LysM repeat protein
MKTFMKKITSLLIFLTLLALTMSGCGPWPTPTATLVAPTPTSVLPTLTPEQATPTSVLPTPTPEQPTPTSVSPPPTSAPPTPTSVSPPPTSAPPTPTSVSPPPTSAPPTPIVHIVQPGENLYRIALMYGTTIEAIAAANGIYNPRLIYVGQRLIIPPPGSPLPPGGPPPPGGNPPTPGPPPPGARTHVVQPGETLFSIALRYGVTVEAIALANNLPNPNLIHAGQILIIP